MRGLTGPVLKRYRDVDLPIRLWNHCLGSEANPLPPPERGKEEPAVTDRFSRVYTGIHLDTNRPVEDFYAL